MKEIKKIKEISKRLSGYLQKTDTEKIKQDKELLKILKILNVLIREVTE